MMVMMKKQGKLLHFHLNTWFSFGALINMAMLAKYCLVNIRKLTLFGEVFLKEVEES